MRTERSLLRIVLLGFMVIGLGMPLMGGGGGEWKVSGGSWVMAYFRQRYDSRVEIDAGGRTHNVPLADPMRVERLHLALSKDGREWSPLKGNEPVWDQWLRDPYIRRGADGIWHLLATGGARRGGDVIERPVCLHAISRDLVVWEGVESLSLMAGVRDEGGRRAGNIWAPEWFLDERTGEAFLVWSSSFEDAGWKRSRLWWSRTRDWKTFSPARELFHPDYSVIDGTLLERGGVYYLFHKEEEFGVVAGERRAIRLATSRRLEGPYEVFEGPLNGGQIVPTITEGPAVMPDPVGGGWLLLYDFCMSNGYGVSCSEDLLGWKVMGEVRFPEAARHGSVQWLEAGEVDRLVEALGWGSSEVVR
ncbi:MAG: hypothetical protein RI897_156 [Verrucomicrobiota bacterium]